MKVEKTCLNFYLVKLEVWTVLFYLYFCSARSHLLARPEEERRGSIADLVGIE
jgi:hypothetical protein